MLKKIWIAATLVSLAAIIFIIGAIITDDNSPTQLDRTQSCEIYRLSIVNLPKDNMHYRLTTNKQIQIGNSTITESCVQDITLKAIATADFSAEIKEDYTIGNTHIISNEYYLVDTGYYTIDGTWFSNQLSPDEFTSRYAPPNLIDRFLYYDISGTKSEAGYTLTFKEPIALETWFSQDTAEVLSVEGVASISNNQELQACTYTCEYRMNSCTITARTTAELLDYQEPSIPLIDTTITAVASPNIPKQLEKFCAYLSSPISIDAEYSETLYCQAFGDKREQTITISATNSDNLTANVNTHVTLTNDSKSTTNTELTKAETFSDNTYSISINGSEPTKDNTITQSKMTTYYQNILTSTIMLQEHIQDLSISSEGGITTIHFYGNEEFANLVRSDALIALYQNPDILDYQVSTYSTEAAEFFITFESGIGIPLSSGFFFAGVYTVDDVPYRLEYRTDQTYKIK